MCRTAFAIPLVILGLLSCAPARADVTCRPGDFAPSGADSYPGSARHSQGSASGSRLQYLDSSPGSQERTGDRTAVPSGGQPLPGNPNCFVTRHAPVKNGTPCKQDRDCPDKRCQLFPDGYKYCVAEQKVCTLPGDDGAPDGAVIALHQQCYECAASMGWKLCGERGKLILSGDQKGVVVRQPTDESGRDDWRSRQPATGTQVNTDSAGTKSRSMGR